MAQREAQHDHGSLDRTSGAHAVGSNRDAAPAHGGDATDDLGTAFHGSLDDHGGSTAAWFGVCILIVAAAVIGVGILLNADVVTIAGVALGLLGLIAAVIMARAGMGVEAKRRRNAEIRAAGGQPADLH